jgi:uncharacterized protein with HEPN domain
MQLSQIDFLRQIRKESIYLMKESNANSFDDFMLNDRLIRAVCKSLEIIGEASSKIPRISKQNTPLSIGAK